MSSTFISLIELLAAIAVVIGACFGISHFRSRVWTWIFSIFMFASIMLYSYFTKQDVGNLVKNFLGDTICTIYTAEACPQEIKIRLELARARKLAQQQANKDARDQSYKEADQRAWDMALKPSPTIQSLNQYKESFREGAFIEEADKKIEELKLLQKQEQETRIRKLEEAKEELRKLKLAQKQELNNIQNKHKAEIKEKSTEINKILEGTKDPGLSLYYTIFIIILSFVLSMFLHNIILQFSLYNLANILFIPIFLTVLILLAKAHG